MTGGTAPVKFRSFPGLRGDAPVLSSGPPRPEALKRGLSMKFSRRETLALAIAAFAVSGALAQEAGSSNTLTLETKDGPIVIKLRPDLAPKTVAQIKALVARKFYDGLVFHRVIAGFMAQTGDPKGTGEGGSDLPDIPAEFTKTPFKRGTLGMARTDNPDSANSQFFICLADAPFLNGKYTVFGEVTSGMDIVDKIKKGDEASNGSVSDPDKIVKLRFGSK